MVESGRLLIYCTYIFVPRVRIPLSPCLNYYQFLFCYLANLLMKAIFPIIYSLLLFVSLSLITVYLFGQIRLTRKAEKKLLALEQKIYKKNNTYEDLYKLGQIYLGKKNYNKAITLFRESLKEWNLNDKIGLASIYNTLGFTYFKLEQYDYAIYYYNRAIEIIPDYILALTNLGFCYEERKNYEQALSTYNQILNFDQNNRKVNEKLLTLQSKIRLRT